METQTIDPKRQAMLDRMAKARAARAANLAQQAAQTPPDPKPRRGKRPGLVKLKQEMEKEKLGKRLIRAAGGTDLFAGIGHQPNGCPAACTAERCVITGINICQHPSDMQQMQAYFLGPEFAEARARFSAARLYLENLDAEKAKKKRKG